MSNIYVPEEDSFLMVSALQNRIPEILSKNKNLKIFEIGCGSGFILEKLFQLGIKKENIFSADINPSAVKKCKELGFNSVFSDLFEKIKGKYDIIIFNPPYLPEDEKEPMDSRRETTGGKKGGEIINKFLIQAKKYLSKQGRIFLLISSLTKGIDFLDYKKSIVAEKKIFFEKLSVLELYF